MSLSLDRLEHVRHTAGKITARCPACAAAGADRSGEHLVVFANGEFGCVAYPGDKEHRRQIAAAIGDRTVSVTPIIRQKPIRAAMCLPVLRRPQISQVFEIAEHRKLPFFAGLELAATAGMLWCATLRDGDESVEAWVLTDSAKRCAQARRLDGKPWSSIGGKKAKTLPGSEAAWPIGAANIGDKPFVALCEGGPDTLAAWSLAWWHGMADEIAPICVAGAGMLLHLESLQLFKGKGIWLFPHRDAAGERAQAKWTAQLLTAGAAWVRPFDVSPHKDLNEAVTAAAREGVSP